MQRDPDARVIISGGDVTRSLAPHYASTFNEIAASGIFESLQADGMLHPFRISQSEQSTTLHSDVIPFISYPYEWCFSQYKAAALLTLDIQEQALQHGACLKDAKADNVQWLGTTPRFIDHSSFIPLDAQTPWRAYRQFCQHFLVPLFLMSRQHPEAHLAMRGHADGMPIAQARAAMGIRDMFSLGRLVHLFMHGKHSKGESQNHGRFSLHKHRALIDHLRGTILGLPHPMPESTWSEYTKTKPYNDAAKASKLQLVDAWLERIKPCILWDIGAHDGYYAVRNTHGYSIAMDADIASVDACFISQKNQPNILPLWMDINNPTPASGFAHKEHLSLHQRGNADGVLLLAVTHHLRTSGIAFSDMAAWLASITKHALVEFIPTDDAQAAPMLAARQCPFDDYTEQAFTGAFAAHFNVDAVHTIDENNRKLVSLSCA